MQRFLFIVVFVLLLAISFFSLFHHWLFIYLQWGWVSLNQFDIDIGDKDYENYMVSKILI